MSINANDIDRMTLSDLEGLIEAEATESVTLEFKAAPYGLDHAGKSEFLKDISGMANTAGGIILIGIVETNGISSAVAAVTTSSFDEMKQRLENLLQSNIEPRIAGVTFAAIPAPSGYVLAIRVPQSSIPPHRVTIAGSNRYYLRSSANVYEASYNDVRTMFLQTATAAQQIAAFRSERIDIIEQKVGAVSLTATAIDKLIIHIMPQSAFGYGANVNLAGIKDKNAFRPIGATGWSPRFNIDGFANQRSGETCHGYTQIFRTGSLEATKVSIFGEYSDGRTISAHHIEMMLTESLKMYMPGLKDLGIAPPFYVAVSLLGVRNAVVSVGFRVGLDDQPIPIKTANLLSPICVIGDFEVNGDYIEHLKPALDALWNAADRSGWTPTPAG